MFPPGAPCASLGSLSIHHKRLLKTYGFRRRRSAFAANTGMFFGSAERAGGFKSMSFFPVTAKKTNVASGHGLLVHGT